MDERTGSAAAEGGGGGGGVAVGERGGTRIELCAFSQKAKHLDRCYLLARVAGDQDFKGHT